MKKAIAIIFVSVATLCACLMCGCMKYNAELYSKVQSWISEDFLLKNQVYGTYYIGDELITNETSHDPITYIINDKEEYNDIFTKNSVEIDFNSEMAVLYIFSDTTVYDYVLTDVSLEENVLKISYKFDYSDYNGPDGPVPYQRCFLLKCDKLSISETVFTEVK